MAAESMTSSSRKRSRYLTDRFDKNITPTETLAARCTVGPFGVCALSAVLTADAAAPPRHQRLLLEGQGSEGLRRAAERAHRARGVAERHRLPEARHEGRRRRQNEALDVMLIDAARDRRLHRIGCNHDAVRLEWRATMLDRLDLDDQPVVSEMAQVDANVRSLKWKLWHGQTDRALDQLETMTSEFAKLRERGNLSATRLLHLAHPLLTYVRSNKSAIINYGARYRSGRRSRRRWPSPA